MMYAKRSRRHRIFHRAGLLAVGAGSTIAIVLLLGVARGGLSSADWKAAADTTRVGATASTTTATTRAAPVVQSDPLRTRAARAWIGSRRGAVTAAVLDLTTHKEWVLDPSERTQTASIIKVDILETLLRQTGTSDVPLSDPETDEAQDMVEQSDDDDATDLWDAIGGAQGIAEFDAKAGLSQTTPNTQGYWGETMTSAADQIKILKQLALGSRLLTPRDQAYELNLMRHVAPGQRWGVSGGVPLGVTVALKNGWVPLSSDSDWEINSIGWIDGDGRDYLLAVLTKHDPSEAYGIATIDRLSADLYAALGHRGG